MAYIKSRKHTPRQPAGLSGTAVAIAALTLPAIALADEQALPEVKVKASAVAEPGYKADKASSPKFTQPLVDTPQTITVVKKELLSEQAATTLSDALRNTPGITMQLGENGNTATGDSIFMRGFDTQASIFVDGVRDLGTISRDTFNTESVEIAKGPAGADNGRGASSGYVNMVSKLPQADNFIGGSVGLGSGSYRRATADVNRKLDADGAALRLNLMVQDSGVTGRDTVEKNSWGIAPSLAFGLNSATRAYFFLQHVEQNNIPDGGVPTIGLAGFYNAAFQPGGAQAGKSPVRVDSENFYGSPNDYDDIQADMFTARFEHDFSSTVTLRNTARHGRSTQRYVLTGVNALTLSDPDPARWTVARTRHGKDQVNEILVNQTNLTASFATGELRHDLSAGAELAYEKQDNNTLALVGSQKDANLYAPSQDDVFAPVAANGAYTRGSTTTASLYAFDTLKLGERVQLTTGLRLDHYNTDSSSATLSTAAANPTLPVGTLIPAALSKSGNLVSWKLGALYKPADNGSIYLSYATSQLPPGGSNFALNSTAGNINNANVDPQKGRNIELGTKWDVLNLFAVSAAVFRSENQNEMVTNALNETSQVGKRRVDGIELTAVGQVNANWQFSTGLALMDPQIISGSTSSGTGGSAATQGGTIQWSPKVAFTSWTTYKLPMGVTLGGGARYIDSVKRSSNTSLNASNATLLEAPDYWVVDAMATYQASRNVSLQLNVYNLFDKEYIASLNNSGARYTPGTPRSARLTANFLF